MQAVLSSMLTACGPPFCRVDFDAAEAGQDVGHLAVHKTGFVELGLDLHGETELAPRRQQPVGSGNERTRLPPSWNMARTSPFITASAASVQLRPFSFGGSNPYSSLSLSSGTSSGFSVMPTVRWPCTLEWPRIGSTPAPGLPILPRMQQQIDHHLHVLDAVDMLRHAHAVGDDRRFRACIDGRRGLHGEARQTGVMLDLRPVVAAHARPRTPRSRACARR